MLAIKIVSHIETRLYGERFWEPVEPLSGLNYSNLYFSWMGISGSVYTYNIMSYK